VRSDTDRPLVGVLGRFAESAQGFAFPAVAGGRYYLEAIDRAGGAGVVVPPLRDLGHLAAVMSHLDAIVLPGGGDIDPARFDEAPHKTLYGVDPDLDRFEFATVEHVVASGTPTLAICRGFQVMNVALGGSLVQHIEDHRGVDHGIDLVGDSRVARIAAGRECRGRSFHHQGIARLADDLVVVGTTADGVVEAVEHATHPWFVGVQWHPELTADEDPCQQAFFDELVNRARMTRKK
jgi:putative glutamine amidotransferase